MKIYGWLFFHLVHLHTHGLKTQHLDCVAGCGWLVGWLAVLRPRFFNPVYFSRSYVLNCFSPKSSDSMFYVCDN